VAACLLASVLPGAVGAAGIGSNEVYNADNVYVRPKPMSWTIGTLYRAGPNVPGVEHMDVQEISDAGWAYGYVYGSFNGCGWVDATYLKKDDSTVTTHCSTDPSVRMPDDDSLFASHSDPGNPDGEPYHTVACSPPKGSLGAYGNYRGGEFTNRYGDLAAGKDVGWRFTTKDGAAAMVKDSSNPAGAPPWFFLPASCLAPGPASAAAPPPSSPPPGSPPPSGTPAPSSGPSSSPSSSPSPGKSRRVCRRHSRSQYCKKLRRTCRRHHSHSRRCRRATR
jgi:hypothetical protein